jgi:hypothetical protein
MRKSVRRTPTPAAVGADQERGEVGHGHREREVADQVDDRGLHVLAEALLVEQDDEVVQAGEGRGAVQIGFLQREDKQGEKGKGEKGEQDDDQRRQQRVGQRVAPERAAQALPARKLACRGR